MKPQGQKRADELNRLRDEVGELCSRASVPEPGLFLASIMSGVDPRSRTSLLLSLVEDVNRGGRPPTADQWSDISDLVTSGRYSREFVSLPESIKAAERLIEFLHAKLKSVDHTIEANVSVAVAPLTDADVERFKRIWEAKF